MFPFQPQIVSVRQFNRVYTRQAGLLGESRLYAPYTLTQARVLYEIGQRPGTRSADLLAELGLDAGYLSRILHGFVRQGLVRRSTSPADRRAVHLSLTARGRKAFQGLDAQSEASVGALLAPLDLAARQRLVESMETIQRVLGPVAEAAVAAKPEFELRAPRPGEIGWVVARHAELYAQEYAWDATFEGLVAKIAGEFLMCFDPARERCWIAACGGAPVGCVFLVKQSQTVGKLRLLLVEPTARGSGLGGKLVAECVAFAREAGYRKLTLWTNDVLHAARRIYERAGFQLAREEKHHSFGHDLVGQFWELKL